jgi:hypothetical protein
MTGAERMRKPRASAERLREHVCYLLDLLVYDPMVSR